MKKILAILAALIFITLSFAPAVFAATNSNLIAVKGVELRPELRPDYAAHLPITEAEGQVKGAVTANVILQLIASGLIYLAGPIAVLMLVIGGLRYVASHGDQNQMEGAKKTITWAIVGLLVIIVSYAIVSNVITVIQQAAVTSSTETAPGGTQPSQPDAQEPPAPPPGQPGPPGG